jgi:LPXTG-motif cell wall-anchored protein
MKIGSNFAQDFEGGIPLHKDPKRVLESFRVEEDPLLQHQPRKFRKQKNELVQVSNSAVLSLCLVTGLSSGAGSVFAEDKAQTNVPLDEPPSTVKQEDSSFVLPQMKVPQTNTSEGITNQPPLDEPASDVTIQQPDNNEQKHTNINKGSAEAQKEAKSEETKTEEKTKQLEESQTEGKTETEAIKTEAKQVPIQKEGTSKPSVEKVTETKKSPSAAPSNVDHDQLIAESDGIPGDIIIPQMEEGGELPKTAGDNLNQAAVGAGLALAGAMLLRRKKETS